MEHHSNLVPWHILAAERGVELRFIPITDDGELRLDALPGLLADGQVKLVGVVHVSNVLGTVNPVAEIARQAHAAGALTLVDASQSVPHLPVDVQRAGLRLPRVHRPQDARADRHRRAVGPARAARGDAAVPGRRRDDPRGEAHRLEVERAAVEVRGRHHADRRGDRAAARRWTFLEDLGMEAVFAHDRALVDATRSQRLREIPGLRILGPAAGAARRGAWPSTWRASTRTTSRRCSTTTASRCAPGTTAPCRCTTGSGVPASARASFHCYSVPEDVDALVAGLHTARKVFG